MERVNNKFLACGADRNTSPQNGTRLTRNGSGFLCKGQATSCFARMHSCTHAGGDAENYRLFSHAARLGGSHLIWRHVATCVTLHLFVLYGCPFDM